MRTRDGVAAVLLAAGESRRMGAVNKLALPVDGVPLVRRVALTLLEAPLEEVVVVLGHDQARVGPLLEDLTVRLVRNPRFAQGQGSSVVAGLAALARPVRGMLVCPGDQPLLEAADLNRLFDAFLGRAPGAILVPAYRGTRGNPVVLDYRHRDAILAAGPERGCRPFMDRHPEWVEMIEWPNDHVVVDVDTAEDYARLLYRLAAGEQRVSAG